MLPFTSAREDGCALRRRHRLRRRRIPSDRLGDADAPRGDAGAASAAPCQGSWPLVLIAVGEPQNRRKEDPIKLQQCFRVEVGGAGTRRLADELREADAGSAPSAGARRCRRTVAAPNSGRKAGMSTLPVACSSACFTTLCSRARCRARSRRAGDPSRRARVRMSRCSRG